MPSDFKAEHFTKAFSGLKWDKAQPRIHFVDFEASLIDGIHLAAPNVKQDIINFLRDGTTFPEIDERPVIADDASDAAWKRYERLEKSGNARNLSWMSSTAHAYSLSKLSTRCSQNIYVSTAKVKMALFPPVPFMIVFIF